MREQALLAEKGSFDRHAWLASNGLNLCPGERVVTLFCYANCAMPHLLADLSDQPTLLLLPVKDFESGTIEAEISGEPGGGAVQGARGFVGIAFRVGEDTATLSVS